MNDRSLHSLNLAFRFVLEIVVLVALLVWGLSASSELIIQLVLGIGAPTIAVAAWGSFVAPKAPRRLDDPARLAMEVVVFGAGVLALIASGRPELGILLAIASGLSLVLMFLWDQRAY